MDKSLKLLDIIETQTTMRYQDMAIRMMKTKTSIPREVTEMLNHLYVVGEDMKWHTHCRKFHNLSQKLNMQLLFELANPFLAFSLKKKKHEKKNVT